MTDESNRPPDAEQPGPEPGGADDRAPSDAPPNTETPAEKKARLIAEHKAKLAAKAAGEGAEPAKAPSGSSASGDPTGVAPSADAEKAAKLAEAKARAAAAKEAAGAAAGAPKPPVKKKDEGPKPEDAAGHPLVRRLRERAGAAAVLEASTFLGQLSIHVDASHIFEICRTLRDDPETQFDYLSDLTCVHWPERWAAPFEVVYNLYSIDRNERVRLKAAVDEAEGVESVTGVWPAANWMEREVFDLYGVRFRNHPDLRRLLLPPDWEGHPLRKDYPLEFVENRWTGKHLPEFDDVQREQLEQRRAYGLEELSSIDERRVRELFRAGKELLPKEHR